MAMRKVSYLDPERDVEFFRNRLRHCPCCNVLLTDVGSLCNRELEQLLLAGSCLLGLA
jgi:hypothetical protein